MSPTWAPHALIVNYGLRFRRALLAFVHHQYRPRRAAGYDRNSISLAPISGRIECVVRRTKLTSKGAGVIKLQVRAIQASLGSCVPVSGQVAGNTLCAI